MGFRQQETTWEQFYGDVENNIPFATVNLESLAEKTQKFAIESVSEKVQTTLNLGDGPLVRVVWLDLGKGQKSRLLFLSPKEINYRCNWGSKFKKFV